MTKQIFHFCAYFTLAGAGAAHKLDWETIVELAAHLLLAGIVAYEIWESWRKARRA